MKAVDTLNNNKLATQPLRDLLSAAGKPTTQQEKYIVASLAKAYVKMGTAFPTKQLGDRLDALYSQALSTVADVPFVLARLVTEHTMLTLESKGVLLTRVTPKSEEKTVRVWAKAFHESDRELAPIVERCRQLCFLALAVAAKWINATLKAAK